MRRLTSSASAFERAVRRGGATGRARTARMERLAWCLCGLAIFPPHRLRSSSCCVSERPPRANGARQRANGPPRRESERWPSGDTARKASFRGAQRAAIRARRASQANARRCCANATRCYSNATRCYSSATRFYSNATRSYSNATRIRGNATRSHSNATRIRGNATRVLSNATRIRGNATRVLSSAMRRVPAVPPYVWNIDANAW